MSLAVFNRMQLGQSPIATNNFTLDNLTNGTMKLVRGNAGAGLQDIMTISALGEIDFPQMLRNYSANGYQKFNGGLIVQWGRIAYSTSTIDMGVIITFPVAFSSMCKFIPGGLEATSGDARQYGAGAISSSTLSGLTLGYRSLGPVTSGAGFINWMAIGY